MKHLNKKVKLDKYKSSNLLSQEYSKKNNTIKFLLAIMTAIIMLIILVGPFYRGLFFPRELIISNIIVFLLLAFWGVFRIMKKDGRLINSPLEICLMVFFLAYLVSFFLAVNQRNALTEVLRNASYLVVFLVAVDISRFFRIQFGKPIYKADSDKKPIKQEVDGSSILIFTSILSAIAIALTSIAVAAGHIDMPAAYEGNRIASPLGYSNTAAAYLMAAYLSVIALIPITKNRAKYLYLASATTLMILIILTFSRGAWLLIPPLCVILIILSPKKEKLSAFIYLAVTIIPALPMAFLADFVFRSTYPFLAWLIIITAAAISVIIGFIVQLYFKQSERIRKLILIIGAGALIGLIAVYSMMINFSPLLLEQSQSNSNLSSFRQVIGSVEPDKTYTISFEVSSPGNEGTEPVSNWELQVLSGLPDYTYITTLEERGVSDQGWERIEYSFKTPQNIKRLEVNLHNLSTKSSISFKSVLLSSEKTEKNLRFFAHRILPDRFYDRIFSFSRDINMDRRLELFQDALKVIRDYPIFGIGGGGWESVYKGYIDNDYNSKQVHNQFLQVWIESGIFGFLSFIGIWITYFIAFLFNLRNKILNNQSWHRWLATLVAALALGIHSFIDWNFAFTSIGFYLFTMLGVGMSLDKIKWFSWSKSDSETKGNSGLFIGVASVIVGITLAIVSVYLFLGLHATWLSQELVQQRNFKAAIAEMDKAIQFDPLRAENYYNLSVVVEEQAVKSGNPDTVQYMISLAQRAYELDPYNVRYALRFGQLLLNYIDAEQGFAVLDRALELNQFSVESHVFYTFMRLNMAEYYIQEGQMNEAKRHIERIWEIEKLLEKRKLSSNELIFVMGRASQLTGDDQSAIYYYNQLNENDHYYNIGMQFLNDILDNSASLN
ncbi:hypothetical protein FJZ33_01410 [Candidatus Poribacteria bacterium]|nr:hypothetical protein [Candidatus Poribacteria bacterium]